MSGVCNFAINFKIYQKSLPFLNLLMKKIENILTTFVEICLLFQTLMDVENGENGINAQTPLLPFISEILETGWL